MEADGGAAAMETDAPAPAAPASTAALADPPLRRSRLSPAVRERIGLPRTPAPHEAPSRAPGQARSSWRTCRAEQQGLLTR